VIVDIEKKIIFVFVHVVLDDDEEVQEGCQNV
jgi:hypothetical protein